MRKKVTYLAPPFNLTSAICLRYLECDPSVRTSSSLSTASCENDEASLTKAWRLWVKKKKIDTAGNALKLGEVY